MKSIINRLALMFLVLVVAFAFSGCVERHYYHTHRVHTDHYIIRHPGHHHHWYRHYH